MKQRSRLYLGIVFFVNAISNSEALYSVLNLSSLVNVDRCLSLHGAEPTLIGLGSARKGE